MLLLCTAAGLAGCSSADEVAQSNTDDTVMVETAATAVAGVPVAQESAIDQLARMKAVIRTQAAADYGRKCLTIDLPDAAFVPIELNGDALPELAVIYGRALCSEMGATGFSSTGGSLVQFWRADPEGPVRLLAEAQMMGFTPGRLKVETLQHGSACGLPGAAGCLVTYRWGTPMFGEAAVERRAPVGGRFPSMRFTELEGAPVRSPRDTASRTEQLALMRAAIRQDARLSYGERCGTFDIPDSAFHEVELTGDDFPEIMVPLAKASCPAQGATGFTGTGGSTVQFWHMARDHDGKSGPIRLLLETQLRGFTPTPNGLVTIQHGVRCPGGAGPDLCRILYAWDERARHLDAVERTFRPREGPDDMRFGDVELGTTQPG